MVDESTVTSALKNLTLSEVKHNDSSKELGRGAYGRVFTVKYCGRTFAAKEIHSILLEYSGKKERYAIRRSFLQECYHCSNLRHPNIVQFIGVYWPEQESDLPVMVMELMDCNLTTFIDKRPNSDVKLKYSILCDVAYGLMYLHAQKPTVIHRDLSPNNVLMTSQLVAKIGDLGVAKALRAGGKQIEKKTKLTKLPGTVDFMPPETFSDNPVYDTSLDVFSYGGITLFVMTDQWPSPSAATEFDPRTRQVIGLTEAKRRWVYLSQLDREWRDLVECCLDNDLERRPAISEVLDKIEAFKDKIAKASSMGSQGDSKPYVKPQHHPVTPLHGGSESPSTAKPRVKPRLSTPPTTPVPQHYVDATASKSAPLGLGEALQSGNYEIGWTRCTNLPAPMYGASVAGDNQTIYVAAGCAPDVDTYNKIFCYKIKSGKWSQLPSPGHNLGILCMVDGKLTVFGGHNAVDKTSTNRVSTLFPDTNSWIRHFPNMVNVRTKPGVTVYMEYIIVAGGARDKTNFNNDIEILNWQQPHLGWELVDIILPVPMWAMSLTVSSDKVYIVGYTQAKGRSASVYQIPVMAILEQGFDSNESPANYWIKLRSAPHHDTALVPGSDPPVIVGGNSHGLGTKDICVYIPSENCWKTCASLSSPRINVAVASVYGDSIIVIGGNTKGKTVKLAMESTLTTAELGKLKSLKNPIPHLLRSSEYDYGLDMATGSYISEKSQYEILWSQYDLKQITKDDILLPKNIEAEVLQKIMVLLVTVNPIETSATHSYLRPLDGHENVYRFTQGGQTVRDVVYYIGQYGACPAAISADYGSTSTVSMMADQCFPNLGGIIGIGIICGIKEKVQMYNVIVSSKVIKYDKVKNADERYSQTGGPIAVSSQLLKLFNQPVQWPDDTNKKVLKDLSNLVPNVRLGTILSGPCFVDILTMENTLSRKFASEAIGIVMDQAYLFAESQHTTANTIVVKAVSNFGSNKIPICGLIAALLAADLVDKCLSNPQAHEVLKGKMLSHQMLQQAKNEGLTISVRHAKILFCGAAKAGKTSFSHLLRNEEHESIYRSTKGADTQQVLISEKESTFNTKVNVVGTNWISLDSKLETEQVTNRLILKLQNKKDTNKDESKFTDADANTKFDVSPSCNEHPAIDVKSNSETVTATDTNDIDDDDILENQSLVHTFNGKPSTSSDRDSRNDVGTEEQMVNVPVSELDNVPETWDLFTFLDTGGQPEFINMLPAINSSTAVTFVILNMSDGRECLNKLVKAQYECEGYNYKEHDLKYTNMHLLKCLLSSIKVSAMKRDCFCPEIVKRVTDDKHPNPVVYIIGTCADVLKEKFGENYDEEVLKINEEVAKLVNTIKDRKVLDFWCKGHNISYVIPIDNTIPRKPQIEKFKCETANTINNIREHVSAILMKKAQHEIPISWFILELELRKNDKVCIPLSEVKIICDRIMPSHKKMVMEQIIEVLKFYHLYGMLLYFSEVDDMKNFVVTKPEWFFLNLSKIMMCKFVNDSNDLYDSYLIEEMDKGICSMELLVRLKLDLQGIKLESFVKLLIHLKIIAPVKNIYFIPTILASYNEENGFSRQQCGRPAAFTPNGECIHSEVEPLLIEFTFGTIPRGLFGFLIVQLLQDNSETYELCDRLHQYGDLISFFIKPCWYISLHDRISYLELQIWVNGEKYSRHYEVQIAVTKALKKVCSDFNWEFKDCRYGFICHKHAQDEHIHLVLLSECQPFPDVIPQEAYCKSWHPTYLSKAHTVWFENLQKISKPPGNETKVTSEITTTTTTTTTASAVTAAATSIQTKIPNETTRHVDLSDYESLLAQDVQMWALIQIVIPSIKAEWEDLAFCMKYEPNDVNAIKNESKNLKECCKKLFANWLSTNHGPTPKTYQTLLKYIKKVEDLAAASETIEKELIQALRQDQ